MLASDTAICGDLNLDGTVNFEDFTQLADNFGSEGDWASGDFDGDGRVDFGDFLILSANFGETSIEDDFVSVTFEKTLDPFAPGAVWVGAGETTDGEAVSVRLIDFVPGDDGVTIQRAIFEVSGESRDTVSLLMAGQFTPGETPGTGSISLTGEQASMLESTTVNGLITTAGTIAYTDSSGERITANWEKSLDPFNPLAVWRGAGKTSDGEPVSVRLFDFVPGDDGLTIVRAIFEVTSGNNESVSLLMSGAFTPGEDPGTGSIVLTGEHGSRLESNTENGLITTAGEIRYEVKQTSEDELASVTWEKSLDPFAPGAVWVGAGETTDGEAVSVRLIDFVPGDDGVTIQRAIFEVSGESRDTVSLLMAGQFTPGETPGTGSISLTGEQASMLESTTVNGLITTVGTIIYTKEGGERVSVSWEKTLDPFNPLAVWRGDGRDAAGEAVAVRLFDFVPGEDGLTIERAIFEATNGDNESVSLLMSGAFTPGEDPGTGSIVLTGEHGSRLESNTENGLITTAGQISFFPVAADRDEFDDNPVSPIESPTA